MRKMISKSDAGKYNLSVDGLHKGNSGESITKVSARRDSGYSSPNPDSVTINTGENPPVPYKKNADVKVKDMGDKAPDAAKKFYDDAVKGREKEESKKRIDNAVEEEQDARKRWSDKMDAHIRKGEGDFRDLEKYAVKHKDQDYEKGSSDADAEEYYARKYNYRGKSDDHRFSLESAHNAAHTPEGREALRRMIAQGEADSARVANEKAKKAQEYLFSGKAFKKKED